MIGSESVGRRTLRVLVPPYITLIFLLVGCGTTQLAASNRHLLEALQTAVSAKNEQWLDAVGKQVDDQHARQAMSNAEYKAFSAVIRSAKAGNWDAARDCVFALSEGQRPTAEDLARVRQRKAAAEKQ